MNIEDLLPSARPKHMRFAYKVVKPGSLWRLEEIEEFQPLPPAKKKLDLKDFEHKSAEYKEIDREKVDPTERWWI